MFGEVPMARTLYRKILDKHVVRAIDANTVLLYVDLHFANEYTSPQAFAGLVERGVKAPVPDAHLCVVDHIIPSADVTPRVIADAASLRQAETLEANCRRNGIDAFYGERPASGHRARRGGRAGTGASRHGRHLR